MLVGCAVMGGGEHPPTLSADEGIDLRSQALERLMFILDDAQPSTTRRQFLIDLSSDDRATRDSILGRLQASIGSRFDFKVSGVRDANACLISASLSKREGNVVTVVGRAKPGYGGTGIFFLEFSKKGGSFTYRGINARASS